MSTRRTSITPLVPASEAVLASDQNPLRNMTPEQRARYSQLRGALYNAMTALFVIEREGGTAKLSQGSAYIAKRAAEGGEAVLNETKVPEHISLALLQQSQAMQAPPPRRTRTATRTAPPPRPSERQRRKVWRFDPALSNPLAMQEA